MYSFPFIWIALTAGFFDSATERLLENHRYWGLALGFGCMLVSYLTYRDKSGIVFGVIAMASAALVDIGVGDLLEEAPHLWISVMLVLGIGTLSILFCTWLIPDEYGFQLLISSTAFTVWPHDGKRRMIYPLVHQFVYFIGCAAFDLAVYLLLKHTHWAVAYACGLVSTAVCAYMLPVTLFQLILFFFATAGFDSAAGAVGAAVSTNIFIQMAFGVFASIWLLFAIFGGAYIVGPHKHQWKQL